MALTAARLSSSVVIISQALKQPSTTMANVLIMSRLLAVKVRLKDSLVSSLQFCKAKDTELAWIDGVLDMRVVKVDMGVMLEEGAKEEPEDSELAMDVAPDLGIDHNATAVAAQRAMKSLFGEDEKEVSEESDIIPTLEPLPPHEVSQYENLLLVSLQILSTLLGRECVCNVFFFHLKNIITSLKMYIIRVYEYPKIFISRV